MALLKNINKNVVVMGIASFFTDISSEMLYPVIPIFLTSILGAPMSIVGFIEGIAESTASILKALSGWFSDLIKKRRPFVVGGYFLSSLAKPILYFAYFWPVVLIARFLDRVGKGIRTSPRDAMIASSSEPVFRGKAFGFHRAMDSLGACIGPLIAIWYLAYFKDNLRAIFLIAFIPAIIAVAILVLFLKETTIAAVTEGPKRRFNFKNLDGQFKRFLFASSIFAIGNSSDAFLIVRSKELGFSVISVILVYVLYNVTYTLFATPAGAFSDRMPRKKVMILGYVIFALVYIGFAIAPNPRWIWILFPVYGLYMAMTDGVGKALASDMVAEEHRATALGLYHFVLGIFAFLASLVAGLLWTHIGPFAPFFYGAAGAILSCVAFATLLR